MASVTRNVSASGTETLAVAQNDGTYRLYGYEWFCSSTDASVAFTLARHVHEDGSSLQGNAGLSMFFLTVRDSDGELNNIQITKLKDKLGTRQLPTAELLLDGALAYKIIEEGRGVASIADMLTLTRTHNAVAAASVMRRMVNFAHDYATRRVAFGKILKDFPLHVQTIARMELEARAATLFVMESARLLGLIENNSASETDISMLRLVTSLMKLYTGKQAMPVMSECLECFGGLGYLEESGLAISYRDAQVMSIWEGTTNVLSPDVLRAIQKSRGTILKNYIDVVNAKVQAAGKNPALEESCEKVSKAAIDVVNFAPENSALLELAARDFAFSLSKTYIGVLLLEHAGWEGATAQDVTAAQRWCCQSMTPVLEHDARNVYTQCFQ